MQQSDPPDHDVVGLVVPYAGPAALLRETVFSVRSQSDPCWRLHVVEDGDQDPTVGPWLRNLGDDRITYERNEKTLGVAANFQRCLEAANTEFVSFPGSDDRLGPDYVALIRRSIRAYPHVTVIQPAVRVIDERGNDCRPVGDRIKAMMRPRASGVLLGGEPLLSSLMHGNWTYFPSLCWRRESLRARGFRQDLATVLDLEVLARIVFDGGQMLVLDDVAFDYRRHSASASSLAARRTDRFAEERQVMHEIALEASQRGWSRASRAARARLTSRLHATLLLAQAGPRGERETSRVLWSHATGR